MSLKRIPYGISNFKALIDKNMYYVDKTNYIELLEAKDDYQVFIRPRRFGKSLFLTMLEAYYDIKEETNFDKYFGNLYIGKNKTSEVNKYLVLKLSFANVITDLGMDKLIESFDRIVAGEIDACLRKYSAILQESKLPDHERTSIYALDYLKRLLKSCDKKLVLLIDEYDNFANNIMGKNRTLYDDLVHEGGYVRTFYKGIKEGTADGVITRTFITGVSPIMLDDITSGANIFTITANDYDINAILGFTEEEVTKLLDYYCIDKIVSRQELMTTLKSYCDGYKFNEKVEETVYNTDMVLYIINNIFQKQEYPRKLIDENVKTDYGRLRNIAENFITKEELIHMVQTGEVGPLEIKERFNLESLYKGEEKDINIKSFLYYLGMFTIGKSIGNKVILKIPNYSVKALYWEYMARIYEIEKASSYEELANAMDVMRMQGNIEAVMNIYAKVINRLSSRDLTFFNEASCKSIFITLAYTDGIYLIASEREASGGYSDLYLKENIIYKEFVKYRYVVEFKHIPMGNLKGDIHTDSYEEILEKNKTIIETKEKEASMQLENYLKDYNILNDSDRILKKFIVLTIGQKYVKYMIV